MEAGADYQAFGLAIRYAVNQWADLTVFFKDGAVPIDDNIAERKMKRVVLNKKNLLFEGKFRGGQTMAILSSITSTCRRHAIEPQRFLTQLLTNLHDTAKQPIGTLAAGTMETMRFHDAAVKSFVGVDFVQRLRIKFPISSDPKPRYCLRQLVHQRLYHRRRDHTVAQRHQHESRPIINRQSALYSRASHRHPHIANHHTRQPRQDKLLARRTKNPS